MADDTKKNTTTDINTNETLNKARAEFEKYRQRMSASGPMPATPPLGRGTPIFFGGALPPGPYPAGPLTPPAPGPMPFPYGSPAMMPPQAMPNPFAGSGPFFENVGKMLHMGVAFATTAFAGGMQVLQGFSGAPMGGYHGDCCQPTPMRHNNECCCQPRHDDCCDHQDSCCNPGVGNCECCC
jgi:hypothetical protein